MTTKKTYCGIPDTAKPTLREASILNRLTSDLTHSLRHPTRKTLTLIDKALDWLRPFESSRSTVTSDNERRELLALLTTHSLTLSPYLDVDRIAWNLQNGYGVRSS